MTKHGLLPATMSASEARNNFYDLVEETGRVLRRFTINLRGKPPVVIMPLDEVEGMEETIEILSDKQLLQDLRQGEVDFKAGKYSTLEDVVSKLENKGNHEDRVRASSRKTGEQVVKNRGVKNHQKTIVFGNRPTGREMFVGSA